MAIAATSIWEIRQTATASNVNGGFFVPGASGTDYSQQNAAQYSLSGGTSVGAGAIILHASAAADMVGNGLHLISGTNASAGWYQITAVSAGASITVDRNCTTGVGATIVFNIGGALSMQSSTDSTALAAGVAGNTYYIRSGTYSQAGNNWNGPVTGSNTAPVNFIGYQSTRGDTPTGTNRPKVTGTSFTFICGQYNIVQNLNIVAAFTAGGDGVLALTAGNCKAINCRLINTTTTASVPASVGSTFTQYIDCEFCSYNGWGMSPGSTQSSQLINCYFHDSVYGIFSNFTGSSLPVQITGCIFENLITAGVHFTSGSTGVYLISNSTFYGGESTKTGIGVNLLGSTGQQISIINNIFYGLTTGINCGDTNDPANYSNYNTFSNNTTDVAGIVKGSNDLAINPQFVSVGQYTGSTATSSGSVLTDSGANFANVVTGTDFLYIISGTGVTTGIYGITAKTTTTLTTDNALGTHAAGDIVYEVIYGHNFTPKGNIIQSAGLNAPNINSLNYAVIGAIQPARSFSSTFT